MVSQDVIQLNTLHFHIRSLKIARKMRQYEMVQLVEVTGVVKPVAGYGLDDLMIGGSSPGRSLEFFSSPPRPDRLWGPPSLLSNGYEGPFTWK
jgi:hypothetical protein